MTATLHKISDGSKFTGSLFVVTHLLSLRFYDRPIEFLLWAGIVLVVIGFFCEGIHGK